MRRVVLYGSGGAGKSALARALASLDIKPHVEIDRLAFDDGTHVDQAVLRERFSAAIAGKSWVVEGVHRDQLEVAISRADVFVWIDLPRHLIALRLITRTLRHAVLRRQRHGRHITIRSLAKREVPFIIKSVRSVPRRQTHALRLAELARQSRVEVVHLASSSDVRRWLDQVRARAGASSRSR